ncbi:MAG: GH36 C-terminal domain-containing protein, partial [Bacillus sp. (in: firmicutes)]
LASVRWNYLEKLLLFRAVATYKKYRQFIQFGDFYRLLSPFEGNETAWLFINKEKTEVLVFYFRVLAEPAATIRFIKLKGLNQYKNYLVDNTGTIHGGDELSSYGLAIPFHIDGDFQSFVWHLKEV